MMIEAKKVRTLDGGTVEDVKALIADGWEIVTVDGKQFVDICDACSVPICTGDVYGTTPDEVKLCESCMPKQGEVKGQPVVEQAKDKPEPVVQDVADLCLTCTRFGARCNIDLPRPIKRCEVYLPVKEEIKEGT